MRWLTAEGPVLEVTRRALEAAVRRLDQRREAHAAE